MHVDALCVYGHVAGFGGQGCHAFCPAVFQPLYAVPIAVENVERMSTPEMPMIAVKSAYSIKSCPLSSAMTRSATALANCSASRIDISFGNPWNLRSDQIDRAMDEGGTTPPSSHDLLRCCRRRDFRLDVLENLRDVAT